MSPVARVKAAIFAGAVAVTAGIVLACRGTELFCAWNIETATENIGKRGDKNERKETTLSQEKSVADQEEIEDVVQESSAERTSKEYTKGPKDEPISEEAFPPHLSETSQLMRLQRCFSNGSSAQSELGLESPSLVLACDASPTPLIFQASPIRDMRSSTEETERFDQKTPPTSVNSEKVLERHEEARVEKEIHNLNPLATPFTPGRRTLNPNVSSFDPSQNVPE